MPIINVNHTNLNYQMRGTGETVVLVHGLGANLAFWHFGIATHLSPDYRVLSYDLRGHGRSEMTSTGYTTEQMVLDLEKLIEYAHIKRCHLIGHSFGASVALNYSVQNPSKVISLTLADAQISCLQPKMQLKDWPHWEAWKEKLQMQGKGDSLPPDTAYIGFELLSWFNQVANEKANELKKRRPSLKKRDMGKRGGDRWNTLIQQENVQKELTQSDNLSIQKIDNLPIPTLAIYGEYSYCLPSCWRLKEHIKFCRASIVPRAGHFHPAVRPNRFSNIVQRFIEQYPPVRWNRWYRAGYRRASIWHNRKKGLL